MPRVAANPVWRVAPLRPRAGARHPLRTGKCSQVLDAHVLTPCVDFEGEAARIPGKVRRRFYGVVAGLKDAHYLRVAACPPVVIERDYISVSANSVHQIQVRVRVGRFQVDSHDLALCQRKAVVPRVAARTVLRSAFARPAPGARHLIRSQSTKVDDARIRRLIHPRPDDRLDPDDVRLQGCQSKQSHRHIRFQICLSPVPNRNPVRLQESRRTANVLQRIDSHSHQRIAIPRRSIAP